MQYWFKLILKSQKNRIYLGVFWAFSTALSGVALLMLSGWFITATALTGIAIAAGLVVLFDMYMPGSGIRLFALSRTVGRYLERIYNHDTVLRLIAVFRLKLFKSLAALPIAKLRASSDSEWLSKLTADLDALDSILLRYTIPTIVAVLLVLSVTFFISFLWFKFAMYLGGFMLLCLVVTIRFSISLTKEYATQAALLLNTCRGDIIEHLRGSFELQSYGLMQHHESKVLYCLDVFYNIQNSLNARVAAIQFLLDLTLGLVTVLLVCIGFLAVNATLIEGPEAVMFVMMFVGTSELLQSMPSQFSTWGKTHFSASRLTGLVENTELKEGATLNRIKSIDFKVDKNIKVAISQKKVIEFKIVKYQLINIQGRSGSGKSTLANILIGAERANAVTNNRAIAKKSAEVMINTNIRLSEICVTQWYKQIAYLEQNNSILTGTLGYNLALGLKIVSEEDIWSVLKVVELEEWAITLPEGLNSWLGETGGKISGGQSRRICLARLLLRDPQLIILDEPFNGIDNKMALRIWENMLPWMTSRMCVLLTHERPDYLNLYDDFLEIGLDVK
jgi:ATP-binding cassette subfamily C protein CydC